VTKLCEGHVPDEVYEQMRREFSNEELAMLTASIAAINLWNRLNISFRTVPGDYRPSGHQPKALEAAAVAH